MAGVPLATAFVRIRPELSGFARDADRGIAQANLGRLGTKHGRAFGASFSSAVSTGILKAAAVIGAVKIGADMFSALIADAREAQRVQRITAATIKATGGAANVTAKQVASLADSLMLVTGADDETIKAGMNMLLTFRNVRNEVGRGNDIFNRASRDLLDMSAALHGGDLSSESLRKTAIQLGKALNDPILGISALRRVGVTFTKTQADMIKGWVEHGQILRAQKYILREVEREFGGTAAAAADPVQRLKTMFRELGERIGTALLGPLNRFVGFISGTVLPAVSRLWNKFNVPGNISAAWNALTKGKLPTAGGTGGLGERAQGGPAPVSGLAERQQGGPLPPPPQVPAWQRALAVIHDGLVKIWQVIGPQLLPALRTLWDGVTRAWGVLVQVGKAMLPAWRDVWTFVKQLWNAVQSLWVAFAPIVGPLIRIGLALIIVAFRALAWLLAHVVGPAIMGLATALKNVMHWGDVAGNAIHRAWSVLINFLSSAWASAWQGIRNVLAAVVGRILGFFGNILHGAAVAFGWIPGIGGKLRAADRWFRTFRDNVNNSLAGINGRTVNVKVAMTSATNPYPGGISGRAASGLYISAGTGPTADDVLIRASRGELVVPANMVKSGAVDHLRGQIPGFATGGQVGSGLTVRPQVPPESQIRATVSSAVMTLATAFAKAIAAMGGGSGNAITAYARKFLGVPYVWGGTTPAGWDCSGFTSYVYKHFGYNIPRTSQQQQLWARASGNVPGALVFFYGTGGSATHVGLSLGGSKMINAYGTGYGTIISSLAGNSGFGIPPGGFRMAQGGYLTEPVLGVGRSGRAYSFGEQGPETVVPGRFSTAGIERRLDRVLAALERLPPRIAAGTGQALNSTAATARQRGAWSTRPVM